MSHRGVPRGIIAKRQPISVLNGIAYFEQEMPMELAQTIRTLRRDHSLTYEEIMWALAETDPAQGQCFGFGRALTERACITLQEDDPAWK